MSATDMRPPGRYMSEPRGFDPSGESVTSPSACSTGHDTSFHEPMNLSSTEPEERLFGAMGWEAVAGTGADMGHLMSILQMVGRTYWQAAVVALRHPWPNLSRPLRPWPRAWRRPSLLRSAPWHAPQGRSRAQASSTCVQ